MTLTLQRTTIVTIVLILWATIAALSFGAFDPYGILDVIGFAFLMLVPGFMVLDDARMKSVPGYGRFALMVATSVLLLMLTGLIGNFILPTLGVLEPLTKGSVIVDCSALLVLLTLRFVARDGEITFTTKKYLVFDSPRAALFAVIPLVFILLSVLGAIRLNDGEGGFLTYLMLLLVPVYAYLLLKEAGRNEEVADRSVPVGLFLLSVALLLMTSLRGWYTTGHDIQVEFKAFELARSNGIWSIEAFKNAYNACLSVTILPAMLAAVLGLPAVYVFKTLFQIVFAVVPGTLYISFRRFVDARVALLGALFFIAFPTFFSDMPMLNRQEIAFLFLSTMAFSLFERSLPLEHRRTLFVVLGLGMVLSHYSTTYSMIALSLFAIVAYPIVGAIARAIPRWKMLSRVPISELETGTFIGKRVVTVWMLVTLAFSSFLWSSVLTDTSSGSITRVIIRTFSVIMSNAQDDVRSTDVRYSLFSWAKPDPVKSLKDYQEKFVVRTRQEAPPETYYPEDVLARYDVGIIKGSEMPLTPLGSFFEGLGMDVQRFNYLFRQWTAKVLQLLLLVGFTYGVFVKKHERAPWDLEFILFGVGSLIMIVSQIVLPVLSAEYGLLRAFQQSMMFLGPFIVIGAMVTNFRGGSRARIVVAFLAWAVFFLSSTGAITQTLGGYPAQLHLNNSGNYYENYYTHASELSAVNWFMEHLPRTERSSIQTDRYEYSGLHRIPNVDLSKEIYPDLVRQDSYVMLGSLNLTRGESMFVWNGDLINYSYPVDFLDETKDLIYNSGGARIYR